MKNQWRIILGLVLTLMIVFFAVMNNMNVPVNLGFTTFRAPLIVVIIGSACIGAVIVSLVATGTMWRQKRDIKRLNNKVEELTTQMDRKVTDKKAELDREYNNRVAELEARQTVYPPTESEEI